MEGTRGGDIHLPAEDVSEVEAEPDQVEEAAPLIELDQEVDVAGGKVFPAGHRAEHARAEHPVPSHGWFNPSAQLIECLDHRSNLLRKILLAEGETGFSAWAR